MTRILLQLGIGFFATISLSGCIFVRPHDHHDYDDHRDHHPPAFYGRPDAPHGY